MATEDKQKSGNGDGDEKQEARTPYKFNGTKRQGEVVGKLIVEGSTQNPVRWADVGGVVELTDDEHERLKKTYSLTKVDEEKAERMAASEVAASSDVEVTTKQQQQRAQATGQPRTDNPGAKPKN